MNPIRPLSVISRHETGIGLMAYKLIEQHRIYLSVLGAIQQCFSDLNRSLFSRNPFCMSWLLS